MHSVLMSARIGGCRASEAFDTLADFARYPDMVEAVREVVVHPTEPDGSVVSDWTVFFRNGLLRWSERDRFDRVAGTIAFQQCAGDFDVFEGGWSLREAAEGTEVRFHARFDFGVPSVASIIEPVAGRVLLENMELITRGLFAPAEIVILGAEHGSDVLGETVPQV